MKPLNKNPVIAKERFTVQVMFVLSLLLLYLVVVTVKMSGWFLSRFRVLGHWFWGYKLQVIRVSWSLRGFRVRAFAKFPNCCFTAGCWRLKLTTMLTVLPEPPSPKP